MICLRRCAFSVLLFSFCLWKVNDAQESGTPGGKRVVQLKGGLLSDAIASQFEAVLVELKTSKTEQELIRKAVRGKSKLGDSENEKTQIKHTIISFTFIYNSSFQVAEVSTTAKRSVLSIQVDRLKSRSCDQALAVVTTTVMNGSNKPETVTRAFILSRDGWGELKAGVSDGKDK